MRLPAGLYGERVPVEGQGCFQHESRGKHNRNATISVVFREAALTLHYHLQMPQESDREAKAIEYVMRNEARGFLQASPVL
jgi:hypothetical protein